MIFIDALDQRNLGCCSKFFAQLTARNPKAVVGKTGGDLTRGLKWDPQQVTHLSVPLRSGRGPHFLANAIAEGWCYRLSHLRVRFAGREDLLQIAQVNWARDQ